MNFCCVHYQVPKALVSGQIYAWLLLQIIWDSVGQVIKEVFLKSIFQTNRALDGIS